jgi:outer membrane lipoprotein carrier protein
MRSIALLSAVAPLALAAVASPLAAQPSAPRAGATAAAAVPSAAATLDRAVAAYKKARTVRATFEQTLANPLTGTKVNASGELVMAQPNRLSVTFAQPAGDRVVADGRWLWVYLPSSAPNQVIKLPARNKGMGGVDMVSELLTSPKSRYTFADGGTATVSGRATRAVVLTPKIESAPLQKAVVWVDDRDATVRQFEVTDGNGLVRTVRMTSWTPNAKINDAVFTFTPPANVRIVDQAALTGGR